MSFDLTILGRPLSNWGEDVFVSVDCFTDATDADFQLLTRIRKICKNPMARGGLQKSHRGSGSASVASVGSISKKTNPNGPRTGLCTY